jgi:hypothetical protein
MRQAKITPARAIAIAALALVTACGVPDDPDKANRISPDDVPYGLLGDTASPRGTGNESSPASPRVFWLDGEDELVPRRPRIEGHSTQPTVVLLLAALAEGPSPRARALGLGSTLAPDITIDLVELSGRQALIDVDFGSQEPSADRLPLAMGQIVLTAVSAPGVDQVQITHDGAVIDVPTPGGALKAGPLSQDDYASLLSSDAGARQGT